ncbi:MAG: YoaK family protein [Acidobacteriaceae bacterium]
MTDSRKRTILAAIPLASTLCAIAGAVDIIAYLLFGRVFVANMTGNTALFAASILTHDWRQAAIRFGVVIAFVAGISVAHMRMRELTRRRERRVRLITLTVEFVLLSTLAFAPHPNALRAGLLLLLAFALAMQTNAFRQIGPVKLNTSFMSGDLENLGEAITDSETPGTQKEARFRTAVFICTWVAYAIGAILGAFGASHFAERALWIPAGLVVLAAIMVLRSTPNLT